uniref:WGS project CBMI000000000 data, contig CS3069_c001852 n=1 Tax=Fusarium clavum TaxID=2594811 RepID=A0A090MGB6_9HYPO|nr:unnamed protein product [Fusarium clavum]
MPANPIAPFTRASNAQQLVYFDIVVKAAAVEKSSALAINHVRHVRVMALSVDLAPSLAVATRKRK